MIILFIMSYNKTNYNSIKQGYESYCDRNFGNNNKNKDNDYRDFYQTRSYVPLAVPVSGCISNLTGYINCPNITRY